MPLAKPALARLTGLAGSDVDMSFRENASKQNDEEAGKIEKQDETDADDKPRSADKEVTAAEKKVIELNIWRDCNPNTFV